MTGLRSLLAHVLKVHNNGLVEHWKRKCKHLQEYKRRVCCPPSTPSTVASLHHNVFRPVLRVFGCLCHGLEICVALLCCCWQCNIGALPPNKVVLECPYKMEHRWWPNDPNELQWPAGKKGMGLAEHWLLCDHDMHKGDNKLMELAETLDALVASLQQARSWRFEVRWRKAVLCCCRV